MKNLAIPLLVVAMINGLCAFGFHALGDTMQAGFFGLVAIGLGIASMMEAHKKQ